MGSISTLLLWFPVFWRNYTDSGYDEGAHLCFDDITINSLQSPKVLKVHLKASKTDPFCVGVDVFVAMGCAQ